MVRTAKSVARLLFIALGLALACLQLYCSGAPPPILPGLRQVAGERVVVLVPGITGSQLRDEATGKIEWGTAARLFSPHDGGRRLALPILPGATPARRLVAFDVIEDIPLPLGVWKKNVYGPIVRLMEANGFATGNLLHPGPGESFFVFPYDWRQDNLEAVRLLAERLAALRDLQSAGSGGGAELRVALVCQSNGERICRYLAKYGAASLEEAEAGRAAPLPGICIDKVLLVGTSNAGSLRILRELNRGRSYMLLGRRWQPESLFTFPSLYQDLPSEPADLFLDEAGRPLAVDLFDAESWRRYGWSIWGEEAAARLARQPFALLGSEAERLAFLARTLDRARRLRRLLAADSPGFGSTRYASLQSLDGPTPWRAVMVERHGRWRTQFTGDRWLAARPHLVRAATALGDGHAAEASQLALSPQERAALTHPPFHTRGPHFEMILERATLVRMLELLAE